MKLEYRPFKLEIDTSLIEELKRIGVSTLEEVKTALSEFIKEFSETDTDDV